MHLLARAARVIAIGSGPGAGPLPSAEIPRQPEAHDHQRGCLERWTSRSGGRSPSRDLPYYINSPIFERVLSSGRCCKNAVFLVQKEVAARVSASPGSRDYAISLCRHA